ncbi:MAG: complex I NDUFA9 subunit family protein [Alphaproteobacteria bacterium]
MKPEQATVIGGSGFIGRYIVRELAKRGTRVRVAVRNPNEALFLKPMGDVGQILPVQANIRVPESIDRAVEGSEIVINLVGILHQSGAQTFNAIQSEGPRIAAEAAARAGATRMIQISAIGADSKSDAAYARTKAEGEAAVLEAFPNATILRPSIVFGPEDGFFNRFAAMARLSPALPLIGGGETKFQPVYVCDVAEAVMAAVDSATAQGATYELGGPRVYSFKELLEYILAETQRSRLLVPLSFGLAKFIGFFAQMAPGTPLTPDQVELLKADNIVADDARSLEDLGIAPTSVEAIVPTYLHRFRRHGQFDEHPVDAGA